MYPKSSSYTNHEQGLGIKDSCPNCDENLLAGELDCAHLYPLNLPSDSPRHHPSELPSDSISAFMFLSPSSSFASEPAIHVVAGARTEAPASSGASSDQPGATTEAPASSGASPDQPGATIEVPATSGASSDQPGGEAGNGTDTKEPAAGMSPMVELVCDEVDAKLVECDPKGGKALRSDELAAKRVDSKHVDKPSPITAVFGEDIRVSMNIQHAADLRPPQHQPQQQGWPNEATGELFPTRAPAEAPVLSQSRGVADSVTAATVAPFLHDRVVAQLWSALQEVRIAMLQHQQHQQHQQH